MTDSLKRLLREIDDTPLSKTLPGILRFAQDSNDGELEEWVRLELRGYYHTNSVMTEETIVPEYRTVPGQWRDEFGRVFVLRQPELGFVNEVRLREGVVELEALANSTDSLYARLPQFAEIIGETFEVDVSLFEFSPSSVRHVIAEIRTELSDRLIARKDRFEAQGSPDLRADSREDVLELRPNVFGIGLNLRALWRRLQETQRREPGAEGAKEIPGDNGPGDGDAS